MSENDDDFPYCPICEGYMDSIACWECHGEGGFHDCGEDCCCCADPEEITDVCPECNGAGYLMECVSLPHTDEQMKRYREQKERAE